ncbi:hypothetical protein HHL26_06750 [Sphingobium sp. TB-6]|uniref:hypothetical protein n=1 Tax=Sphingobium sp. TB-6 TaxID=2728850 RepID=UPI00146AE99A|nr:hypothetical protein [Sphingobium sp. TB-6]NML88765.1 hypothetical protein [Sphingobium sp. TB-6]
MTVRVYRSTDASAPTLNGTVGSLLTVLDAVLVNGYGAKAAAGWTIAYTGTNKRVYTMAAGGTGFSVYIDDAAPGAAAAREARFCGFEAPTGLGTGSGQWPTSGQSSVGIGMLVIRKSTTADSTARAWTIVADGHTFYLFIETGDKTQPIMAFATMFGDFFSYSSSDQYNCALIGRPFENTGEGGAGNMGPTFNLYEPFSQVNLVSGACLASTIMGHYLARNYNGVGSSINFGKHSDQFKKTQNGGIGMNMGRNGGWSTGGNADTPSSFPYPAPPNSGMFLSPVWVHHNGFVRGYLKGLWDACHFLPMNHNDTFSGTGNMSGKSLLCQQTLGIYMANNYAPGQAQVVIETSDTWS